MGIREVMVIVGGKSVGDVVELLGRRLALRARPDLPLPARRARHRPRHRARPRLRRRRRVLLHPRRQHPARAGARAGRRRTSRPGRTGPARCSTGSPIRSGSASPSSTRDGRVIGFEEKPATPKSDLIPIGVYFLRPDAFDVIDGLSPVGPRRVRDHRRPQPLRPRRPAVRPGLRRPLDRCRDGRRRCCGPPSWPATTTPAGAAGDHPSERRPS